MKKFSRTAAIVGFVLWALCSHHFLAVAQDSSRRPRSEIARSETFPVKVDYSRTLREMIEDGKYDFPSDGTFTAKSLAEDIPHAITGKGVVGAQIVLLHFNRNMSSAEVNKEIKARGLEPVKIEHVLAFGAQHPELQRKFTIVFPGACWIEDGGRTRVMPCLTGFVEGKNSVRQIGLLADPEGPAWSGDDRFAAIRTNNKK